MLSHQKSMLGDEVVTIGHAIEWVIRCEPDKDVAIGVLETAALPEVRPIPSACTVSAVSGEVLCWDSVSWHLSYLTTDAASDRNFLFPTQGASLIPVDHAAIGQRLDVRVFS